MGLVVSLGKRIRNSRLWRSIFRHPIPSGRRERIRAMLAAFPLHLHPPAIHENTLRPAFTWGTGLVSFYLFVIEVLTGVLLMFYYRPTAAHAYLDMLDLRDVVSLGILREVHRWAAHAMVIVVMLHALRVFMTGSYKSPREFNWVIGVMLLVLTLLLSFTGYLLPWDQLSLWAVTVGTNMAASAPFVGHQGPGEMVTAESDLRFALLGSSDVSEATLNRFYVLHCVALPLLASLLVGIHFWRIRKDGGLAAPA